MINIYYKAEKVSNKLGKFSWSNGWRDYPIRNGVVPQADGLFISAAQWNSLMYYLKAAQKLYYNDTDDSFFQIDFENLENGSNYDQSTDIRAVEKEYHNYQSCFFPSGYEDYGYFARNTHITAQMFQGAMYKILNITANAYGHEEWGAGSWLGYSQTYIEKDSSSNNKSERIGTFFRSGDTLYGYGPLPTHTIIKASYFNNLVSTVNNDLKYPQYYEEVIPDPEVLK